MIGDLMDAATLVRGLDHAPILAVASAQGHTPLHLGGDVTTLFLQEDIHEDEMMMTTADHTLQVTVILRDTNMIPNVILRGQRGVYTVEGDHPAALLLLLGRDRDLLIFHPEDSRLWKVCAAEQRARLVVFELNVWAGGTHVILCSI